MRMPRLRLRRLLTGVAVCCFVLLGINLTLREKIFFENNGQDLSRSGSGSGSGESFRAAAMRKVEEAAAAPADTDSSAMQDFRWDGTSISGVPDKLWFMKDGGRRPQPSSRPKAQKLKLWPNEDEEDRIVNQLMYVPPDYYSNNSSYKKNKKILLFFGKGGWHDLPLGRKVFLRDKCPVNTCELTTNVQDGENADAVFFKDRFTWPNFKRSMNQIWILFLLECPLHTQSFVNLKEVFNWTATYRHDSDIVAPYEKYVSYDEGWRFMPSRPSSTSNSASDASSGNSSASSKNWAQGKTKKVAWFVSNCAARNQRLQYARELAKHIEVDIYGSCGKRRCPRTRAKMCFDMLDRDYKFYLAFENSNCKYYITEKFFVNGLGRNVVPLVMGARPEDYKRASPPKSYIHVEDFDSPAALAQHLRQLDENDTLYNEYFDWKGKGEFVNTYFWCRLCSMLHAPIQPKVYSDVHTWWAGPGTCSPRNWRDTVSGAGQPRRTDSSEANQDRPSLMKSFQIR